ncbi:MAG: hypothetical protein AAGD22_03585 [Verrucomicrobiota bacterium]
MSESGESGIISFWKRPLWIVVALTILGGVLRWSGLFTELWLDEIWSVQLAAAADSWVEVLTGIRISNNHPLNTWWLMMWGERGGEMWWRLHSWLAGVAMIPVCYWVVRRGGGPTGAGIGAAVLVTVSFFNIVYASEARGYVMAMLCVVVGLGAIWGRPQSPGWRMVLLYQVSAVTGVLANAGYLVFWVALVLWHVGVVMWERRSWIEWLRGGRLLGLMHGPVGVLMVGYWWYVVRKFEWVGGGHLQYRGVLDQAAGWMFNCGWISWPSLFVIVIVILSLIWLWYRGWREASVFFLLAIFLMPWLVFRIAPPKATGYAHLVILLPQYFFIPGTLGLLATGWALADFLCVARPRGVRAIAVVLFTLSLLGAIPMLSTFYRYGRGGIGDAVREIANSSTPGEEILVGFNTPGRMPKEVLFHAERLPGDLGKRLRHIDQPEWKEAPPEWVVGLVTGPYPEKVRQFEARDSSNGDEILRYKLFEAYRYGEATGYHCLLFRRESSED